MRKIIYIIFIIISQLSFSQNLVENPSFETVDPTNLKCSWYLYPSEFVAAISTWTYPTSGSTDIFDMTLDPSCYCHPFSTHASSHGSQLPRTGNTMSNITVYGSGNCTPYREYLQGHLSSPLVVGEQYLVQFYISLADNERYATNNFGVHFTTSQVSIAGSCVYNVTPQLNYSGAPITDTDNWTLMSFTYTATDAFEYFSIGNFFDDVSTQMVEMPTWIKETTRYFIDDISIEPITNNPTSDFTVTQICEGDASTIAYTGTASASATYNWNWNGGTVLSGTGQGPYSVTWASSGNHNVSLTVTESGNTSTQTTNIVTVTALPAIDDIADLNICDSYTLPTITGSNLSGNQAYYTATNAGGTQINEGDIITTSQTIYIYDANGVCSDEENFVVTIEITEDASFTVSDFCEGSANSATITGTTGGVFGFNPSPNDGAVINNSNGTITNGVGGAIYNVEYTTQGNCPSNSIENLTVFQNPTPSISGNDFCAGSTTVLDAGTYTSYLWNNGDVTQTITVNSGGTYSVTVTDANSCTGVSDIMITENQNPTPSISGNDFCAGSTTVLDAGTYTSYLWNNGGVTQVITVNNGGTYSVTVTDANSCTGVSDITITENQNPTPTINGNDFCTGNSTVLSLGNTYNSYLWGTNESTQSITVNAGGTYAVTVTDNNNCSSITDISISENPNLNPIISGSDFCEGTSSTLDVGTGYASYNWSTNSTNQTINVISTGMYSVTVTDAFGCSGNTSISINENANPTPSINGYDFCQGLPTDIFSDAGYIDYLWSTSETTALISVSNGGTYSVTVTDNNGCVGSNSITINQYPLPTPIIDGNDFCSGNTETLSTTVSYASYNWSTSENTPQIIVSAGGNYSVTVIDANGCQASSSTSLNSFSNPTPTIIGNDFCENTSTDLNTGAFSSYLWSSQETTQTINVLSAGTYSVTVIDNNGCEGSSSITISTLPNPTPIINGNLDVCENENSTLDAGNTYSNYIWNNGQTTQIINANTTNTYTVTVTDANGCEGSVSVNFIQHSNPSPVINGNAVICQGNSTLLSVDDIYDSYQWNINGNSNEIQIDSVGLYSVTVTDNFGCSGSNVINVVEDDVTISITPSTTICSGTDINIQASILTGIPTYTYHWSNGFSGASQTLNPTNDLSLTVYVTDNLGCTSETQTINISVIPGVELNVSTNKDSICPGDELLISSLIQNGVPPYSLYDQSNNIISLNSIIHPSQGGDFIYTVIDACKSSDIDTIKINFYPIPEIKPVADITVGCSPLEVHFTADNLSESFISYNWNFDNHNENNLSLNSSPTHIFETTGSYDVTISAITNNGCKVDETVNNMITVHPQPEAGFEAVQDVVSEIKPIVYFENYSTDATDYIWSFGDGNTSSLVDPSHSFYGTGEYNVMLTAVNEFGCKDVVYHSVKIINEFTLYVPSAFSPDFDGINDGFRAEGHGIDLDNFLLKVYNRWGEVIWETSDAYEYWNGNSIRNNKLVETGVYVWRILCKDSNGVEHEKSGSVNVIR